MANSKGDIHINNADIVSYGNGNHNLGFTDPEGSNAVLEESGHEFGKGADNISIGINAASTVLTGLKNGWIDLGEGNNSLTISVAGGSGTPPANSKGLDGGSGTSGEGALLLAGKGSDKLSVSGVETALDTATVRLGAGANSVTISAAAAMTSSALVTEGGNDAVIIAGAVAGSTINLGNGANTLTLNGALEGGSTITAGSGNDKASIAGDISGSSTVSLGAGNNALTLGGNLAGSGITASSGADVFTINGNVAGSTIDLSNGANTLALNGNLTGSGIIVGSGNDKVSIAGDISGSSTVSLGAGNNALTLGGNLAGSGITAGSGADVFTIKGNVASGTILAGNGNNTLAVGGYVSGSEITAGSGADAVTINGAVTNSTLNLSDGANTLNLNGNMTDSGITVDSGNDKVSVTGNIIGGNVKLGAGNNTFTLNGDFSGTLPNKPSITSNRTSNGLSTGMDVITINGNVSDAGIGGGDGRGAIVLNGDLRGSVAPVETAEGWGYTGTETIISMNAGVDVVTVTGAVDKALISLGADDDTLTLSGTITDSVILAGGGNDVVILNGKAGASITSSLINGRAGKDTVILRQGLLGAGTELKGSDDDLNDADIDTLRVSGGGMVTLSAVRNGAKITGFEILDTTDKIAGTLYVRAADLPDGVDFTVPDLVMTEREFNAVKGLDGRHAGALADDLTASGAHVLRITGDKSDRVYFEAGWEKVGTALGCDVLQKGGLGGQLLLVQSGLVAYGSDKVTPENAGVEDLLVTARAGAGPTAAFDAATAEGVTPGTAQLTLMYADAFTAVSSGTGDYTFDLKTGAGGAKLGELIFNIAAGTFTVELTDAITEDLLFTYSLDGGPERTLRVREDTADFGKKTTTLTPGALGSFYSASGDEAYKIVGGAADDDVFIGGTVNAGGKIDLGYGQNTLQVTGSLGNGGKAAVTGFGDNAVAVGSANNAAITLGGGDDAVTVAGSVLGGKIELGAGVNSLTVGGHLGDHTDSAKKVTVTGKGDNTITISSAYGSVIGAGSAVILNSGNDAVTTETLSKGAVVNLGAGSNIITLNGDPLMGHSMDRGSKVTAGAGDDEFTAGGRIKGGVVDLGDGRNTVTVSESASALTPLDDFLFGAAGAEPGKPKQAATIKTGKGDDTIELSISTAVSLMSDASIADAGGNNAVTLSASAAGAVLMDAGSKIATGAGRDEVILENTSGGAVTAMRGASSISTGAGDDEVTVEGDIAGAASNKPASVALGEGNNIFAQSGESVRFASFTAGKGDDALTVTLSGAGAAFGSNTVALGNGNNSFILDASGATGGVLNIAASAVGGGTGVDEITLINAGLSGTSAINTGAGNDLVTIDASGGNALDAYKVGNTAPKTGIDVGAGDDAVFITGNVKSNVKAATLVNLGAGTNTLDIDGDAGYSGALSDLKAAEYVKILGGAGADAITITGAAQGLAVNAGAGDDALTVTLSGAGAAFGSNTVALGNGNNSFTLDASGATGGVLNIAASTVGGGTGVDEITLTNAGLSGTSTINTGAGNDLVRIDASGGNALDAYKVGNTAPKTGIDVGAGNDAVAVSGNVQSSVKAATLVNLGAGTNTLVINGNAGYSGALSELAKASEYVKILGGAGADTITITGAAQGLAVNAGAGNDVITLGRAPDEKVLIDGGAGTDVLKVNALASNGLLTLSDIAGAGAIANVELIDLAGAGNVALRIIDPLPATPGLSVTYTNSSTGKKAACKPLIITGRAGDAVLADVGEGSAWKVAGTAGAVAGLPGAGYTVLEHSGTDAKGKAVKSYILVDSALSRSFTSADPDDLAGDVRDMTIILENPVTKEISSLTDSTLIFGDHADSLTVSGAVVISNIDLGGGDDTVEFRGVVNGSSSVDLGDGANSLTLRGSGAMSGAVVTGGAGDDTVSFAGVVNGSTVDLGGGDNSLTVRGTGEVSGTPIIGEMSGTTVTCGTGDDEVSFNGVVNDSIVDLGDGANTLTVNKDSGAMSGTTVTCGAGIDTVWFYGVVNGSTVHLGDGDNSLIGVGFGEVSGTTVTGGAGDDTVSFNGVVNGAAVDLGDGDNSLGFSSISSVDGEITVTLGAGADTVTMMADTVDALLDIDLGGGNDSLTLNSVSAAGGGGGVLKGGAGTDTLRLEGGNFSLGGTDQLSFNGFESIDLTSGLGISPTSLTVTAAALEANGENLTQAITLESGAVSVAVGSHVTWVKGDASSDTLTLNGATSITSVGVYRNPADGNTEYDVWSYEAFGTSYAVVSKGMNVNAA